MSSQNSLEKCEKCDEKYTSKYHSKYKWCKPCQMNNLKIILNNWTSENEKIDNIIQSLQLNINEPNDKVFEWISYDNLNDIKEIGEGYFVKYLAIWKDGPLYYDHNKYEYVRLQNKEVALYKFQNIVDGSILQV
jgi:hypothetical protein